MGDRAPTWADFLILTLLVALSFLVWAAATEFTDRLSTIEQRIDKLEEK